MHAVVVLMCALTPEAPYVFLTHGSALCCFSLSIISVSICLSFLAVQDHVLGAKQSSRASCRSPSALPTTAEPLLSGEFSALLLPF